MSLFSTELGKSVSKLMDDLENWHCGEYYYTHKPTGIKLWVSNGGRWFRVYEPSEAQFGLIERHFLYKKALSISHKRVRAIIERGQRSGLK